MGYEKKRDNCPRYPLDDRLDLTRHSSSKGIAAKGADRAQRAHNRVSVDENEDDDQGKTDRRLSKS